MQSSPSSSSQNQKADNKTQWWKTILFLLKFETSLLIFQHFVHFCVTPGHSRNWPAWCITLYSFPSVMMSAVCFVILTNQRPALWLSSQSEAGIAAPSWWRLGICIVIDSRRVSNLHNQSANKSLLATLYSADLLWYLITIDYRAICNVWVRQCSPGEIPSL